MNMDYDGPPPKNLEKLSNVELVDGLLHAESELCSGYGKYSLAWCESIDKFRKVILRRMEKK